MRLVMGDARSLDDGSYVVVSTFMRYSENPVPT